MPLARRIERLDAAEPVAKTLEDVLALGPQLLQREALVASAPPYTRMHGCMNA